VCCIDICVTIVDEGKRGKGERPKAQVSTTCVPWVLIIFMVSPRRSGVAMPHRAGMVVSGEGIYFG